MVDDEVKEKVVHAHLSQRAAAEIGAIPDKETQRKVADVVDDEIREKVGSRRLA
jgi:hypothetical protein